MIPYSCRIELLGGLRVQLGEHTLTRFSTHKNASLLAYLAFHPHQRHPREILIEIPLESLPRPGCQD